MTNSRQLIQIEMGPYNYLCGYFGNIDRVLPGNQVYTSICMGILVFDAMADSGGAVQ